MFSCRLSEEEGDGLFELLELVAQSPNEFRTNRFRALLILLKGRLSVDYLGYLRLKKAPGELDLSTMERLNRRMFQDEAEAQRD